MTDEIKKDAENSALSNEDLGNVTGGAGSKTLAATAGATPASKGTNPLHSPSANQTTAFSTDLEELSPEALSDVTGGVTTGEHINTGKLHTR